MAVRFLQRVAGPDGLLLASVAAFKVAAPLTATYVPGESLTGAPDAPGSVTDYVEIGMPGGAVVTSAAVLAAISGQVIEPSAVNMGPSSSTFGTAMTVGAGTDVLATPNDLALEDNTAAVFKVSVIGRSSASIFAADSSLLLKVDAGSLSQAPFAIAGTHDFGLSPSISVAWSAGAVQVTCAGPAATITGTADVGGTATEITVAQSISGDLAGRSVTISGASGTPGLNGAHVVASVTGAYTFTVAVTYVAPDTIGSVVLTTPPTITWSAYAIIVVTG